MKEIVEQLKNVVEAIHETGNDNEHRDTRQVVDDQLEELSRMVKEKGMMGTAHDKGVWINTPSYCGCSSFIIKMSLEQALSLIKDIIPPKNLVEIKF